MAALIERVRLMVGDPVIAGTPTTSVFTDQQIQDALDHHRTDVFQDRLVPRPTPTPTTVDYKDYQARAGFWEDDVTIVDATWTAVTPAGEDLNTGHWTFTVSENPPLFITGKAYDIYGAAVEILEAWQGSATALGIDSFAEDGQSFQFGQRTNKIAAMANEYRRKALPAGPRFAGRHW